MSIVTCMVLRSCKLYTYCNISKAMVSCGVVRCGDAKRELYVCGDDGMAKSMKRVASRRGERCNHDVTFPFPFSFFELLVVPEPSVMIVSLSAEAAAASSIPGVTASQIRIVLSSEQDANIRSFFGFQATEFTLPSPWPDRTSSSAPESRCHTYTLPSGQSVNRVFYHT